MSHAKLKIQNRENLDEVRRKTLAQIYELILALPIKDAHRHADNMNDGQRGNGCETRSFGILPSNDTDEIKGGKI
jgi:hypothetical protein